MTIEGTGTDGGNGSGGGGKGGGGGNGSGNGSGSGRAQRRRVNPLPFRSLFVPNGTGHLTGSITSEGDSTEALLVLRADENTDFTCDRVWPDEEIIIESFSITAKDNKGTKPKAQILPDKKTLRLQGITPKTTYDVEIQYREPDGMTNFVDRPVLRAELHRPPSDPKAKKK